MNQAIKVNPNFATAVHDRGITDYDRRDYDRTVAAADPLLKAMPTYAVSFNGHDSAYENRREGDRIIQDPSPAIRNNQYNAYAYSPDTFPPVSQPAAPVTMAPAVPGPAIELTPAAETQPDSVPMPRPNPWRPLPKIRQSQR